MKKYLLKRLLLSAFSLVVVIFTVLILIYNLMDRSKILKADPEYTKSRYNEREVLKLNIYQKYGYLSYYSAYESTVYKNASEDDKFYIGYTIRKATTVEELYQNENVKKIIEEFNAQGYETQFFPTVYNKKKTILSNAQLLFVHEGNAFERLGSFFSNLFTIETPNTVKDDTLTADQRYVRWEWDPYGNMPALVGSGTEHRYLIYFNDKFPFVHQNIIHINLGKSYILSNGKDTVEYMKSYIGDTQERELVFPKDLDNPNAEAQTTTYDFQSARYNYNHEYGTDTIYYKEGDRYDNVTQYRAGTTRIGTSFLIGIVATFAAYIIGLPIGIWMAQRKDKVVDKIGNLYIIFIMAVPSLAYIYIFASIGKSLFHLPMKYQLAEVKILAFILPAISLMLPSLAGLMKWMRRYMIDQKNSDYVKFARSQGLSEGEIFSKHISKNAFIFLVHGIPVDILACLVGAIITESVYGIPGVGRMLTDSINNSDNAVIVGVTVFYTALTIIAMIAGDLLLAKYDPRISLSGERS